MISKNIKSTLFMFAFLSTLCFTNAASAQDHITGGGSFSEDDFQAYINKINAFLHTQAGLAAFPKIQEYNRTHRQSFFSLVQTVVPKIVNGPVYDDHHVERDCVSHITALPPYFECNSKKIPKHTFYNEPSVIRITTHEIFVITLFETPMNDLIRSVYPYSSRITDYLRSGVTQEWAFRDKPRVSGRMTISQINQLIDAAEGAILVNNSTDEHLAMVRGKRDLSYTGQRQAKQGGDPFQYASLTKMLADDTLDVGFTIISENSRGLEVMGSEENQVHENIDLDSKMDWAAGFETISPHRLKPKTLDHVLKTLRMNEAGYELTLNSLKQLSEGLPGNLVMMNNQSFAKVKLILTMLQGMAPER